MANLDITPANVVASETASKSGSGNKAAESIAAGDVVIRTDLGMKKASAADAELVNASGIALASCETGQPCVYVEQDVALELGAVIAAGEPLYLSNVAGKIVTSKDDLSTGEFPVVFGTGIGENKVSINFSDPLPFKGAAIA